MRNQQARGHRGDSGTPSRPFCSKRCAAPAAARHLLRTAAGLESPLLGEPEILGQLQHAYRSGAAAGATGPALEQLIAHAVRAGRRVRTETGVAKGAASLTSTVAVIARELVGNPGGRRALVIGGTRTARAAAARLIGEGWSVTTGSVTQPESALSTFDVVVACSGRDAAIGGETLRAAAHGRTTPLLVVDLSVPRDIDPAARGVAGVLLYDVDDVAGAGGQANARARRRGGGRGGAAELRGLACHAGAGADDRGPARAPAARASMASASCRTRSSSGSSPVCCTRRLPGCAQRRPRVSASTGRKRLASCSSSATTRPRRR
jgi:Glutamyl-tRNAGlu reductase, N-terminal domain/Shikimate / quinate 5-dehydrogenase